MARSIDLDGWFNPLLLLPFLYVILIEKKDLPWLGSRKPELRSSISFGLTTAIFLLAIYHPIFLHHIPLLKRKIPSPQDIFTDLVWYPVYEEITYRSFLFAHFADFETSGSSKRNLFLNLLQALLFLSIHRHHIISGIPSVLIGVLALAILNGLSS